MLHFPSPDIGMFGRRQRHVRGHRVPVTIVRGPTPHDGATAIVIDTFGADDVAPLPGGCSCCTVRVGLQSAVRQLLAEREQNPLARVLIETDEDLAPILRTFVSEQALAQEYHVKHAPPLSGSRFALSDDEPIAWETFSRFIATLTALRGPDLLEMKGLLNITECRGPVAVHLMQHLAQRPVELQAWPDGECASRLEFVTRGIEEKMVRDLFDSVRALT